ncbi:HAMP domain-containing sensor histidine kinase [Pseudoalteromonas sp. R3]|uniref:HAMP domain-containing sensor histidine kinase n=1 Tax=Pseudoalteromonas sp. R3 TaxID=1709477 RepID=UPI0006B55DDA|nr:HAMP domain-containing sensor histidine kinase [Pseudoalteromonas sp. R3]AZZ98850.1 HAMP domain-containing histidine kinase [Pseudoalteromonas sp. R3]
MISRYHLTQTAAVGGTLWVGMLLLLWLISQLLLWQDKQEQQSEFSEFLAEVKIMLDEHGFEHVLQEFELDEDEIWSDTEARAHLLDDGWLVAIYEQDKLLFGANTVLSVASSAQWQSVSFGEEGNIELLSARLDLPDSLHIHYWQKRDDMHAHKAEFYDQLLGRFALLSLPFILAVIVWLQLKRTRPLRDLSAQLEKVAHSPDSKRTEVSTSHPDIVALSLAINQMLDEITRLHGNMKTMSVGIAHDLKTPLSRISNRLQSMYQDLDDTAALEGHIDKASSELAQVINTFNNLVRLNAIESGKHIQGFKTFDLSALLDELAQSYQPVFEDSGRRFDVSIVPSVHCHGDKDLLGQLICNLLENALEHSHEQSHVWLRLQSHTDSALLQIGDDGPGIPQGDQHKVFDKFYRADISRGRPGNGLGLSIVRAICDVHKAQLCLLEQQPGAVFNIEIPTRSARSD